MRKYKRGFTIVELTLSMTFISILLLAIAMLVLQIGSIYTKGMTLREVNTAGQLISDDLQRSLNVSYDDNVTQPGDATSTGSRLCVGSTIYAWNYGPEVGKLSGVFNVRAGASGTDATDIRFVKFTATGTTNYCQRDSANGNQYPPIPNQATELLPEGNNDIALHSFTLSKSALPEDTAQTIYRVTMVIGTRNVGAIIGAGEGACTPGLRIDGQVIDDDRCSVNQFDFTARSGRKGAL